MTVKYKVGIRNLARSIILQNQPKNLDVAYKKNKHEKFVEMQRSLCCIN